MSEEIENSGNQVAAPICTCGPDLPRNGGYVHNYACPMTPKCMHLIPRINLQTGETEQRPCGSRLERQWRCHGHGCPCLPLCPHCGTSMDQRGVHSVGCPNRTSYSFENPGNFLLPGGIDYLTYNRELRNAQNLANRLLNLMRMNPVSPPSIIDGDFEIKGECSVCLLECEQSQRVLKPSGCDHCFHADCLTPWIREHSTCPNCRGETQTILKKN